MKIRNLCPGSGQALPGAVFAEYSVDRDCTHFHCEVCNKQLALPNSPAGRVRKHDAPAADAKTDWPYPVGTEPSTEAAAS